MGTQNHDLVSKKEEREEGGEKKSVEYFFFLLMEKIQMGSGTKPPHLLFPWTLNGINSFLHHREF